MKWLFYVGAAGAILYQLPQVRQLGQRKTTAMWLAAWVVAVVLGTLYYYGGDWLSEWRLV